MQLRDYQVSAIDRLRTMVRAGQRRVCVVMPTGTGKSLTASAVVKGHLEQRPSNSVAVYVHRTELADQMRKTLARIGVESRSIVAGHESGPSSARVTVAMVQSVDARPDLAPSGSLVVFDECHHLMADTWRGIAEKYSGSVTIGLTATPERADGKPLGDVFDALHVVLGADEAVERGYLVPCRVYAPDSYTNTLSGDAAEIYLSSGRGRKALVFATNCPQSKLICEAVQVGGYRAAHIDGKTHPNERKRIIQSFAAGETRVLCSVGVLTEGFDDPSAEVAIVARGADHCGTWLQIAGRVLRLSPGKTVADIWDLRGIVHRHGLPTEPRDFSLTGEAIQRRDSDRLAMTRCKSCGAVSKAHITKCPVCGTIRPPPKDPEITRRQIAEYVARETPEKRNAYREQLEKIARERGYHRGWVDHRMRAKYG